jgi:two-component system, NtrC family, nitrogen regulation sensor histidine kinase GlnL
VGAVLAFTIPSIIHIMVPAALAGLDLLATAILLADQELTVHYANPAAENLFKLGNKGFVGRKIHEIFQDSVLDSAIEYARANDCDYTEHDLRIGVLGRGKLHLSCTVSPIDFDGHSGSADLLVAIEPNDPTRTAPVRPKERTADVSQALLLEFRHIEQQIKIAREERLLEQSQASRELIRNLAHEIRNPLGGIRGAAQLLERELDRPNLREYTQVIIKEADRLQWLMDSLLRPHRLPQLEPLNIHEVLERVRSLILAEYPQGIDLYRDYDFSLPLLNGDKEQLIQVVLNIARNAAQAMNGKGQITLRTRVVRQVTLVRKRYRHALELRISDTGPGIPEDISEDIFFPLVSGREGGSGLGLTLAQTFIAQHGGTIAFESRPGSTTFILMLPFDEQETRK